ncbi:hypothetical protein B0H10DRAFT_2217935 [Mycena sp. CBHHK59/15]|nr:hypothetical protein B0H10DRAFT_2217935 [Mycena sp. CBHHK59/15]
MSISKLLGDPAWADDSTADPRFRAAVSSFFGFLSKAEKLADVPPELYDLRQQDASASWRSPLQLRWEIINEDTYYFLSPEAAASTDWAIVVSSAASALDIMRRDWATTVDVARNLVARGISFKTFIGGPLPPSAAAPAAATARRRGLGYRQQGFRPDPSSYLAYATMRDRLLRSPRGRAALMMGGVVARLARDVVAPESVLSGPTANAFTDGRCFSNASSAYCDDHLTDDEMDLICGVYEVDTVPQGGAADNVRFVVAPALLVGRSGLNMGYWTRACEDWFQRRLASINVVVRLQTQAEWKHNLRFLPFCYKMVDINEYLAREFLEGHEMHDLRKPHIHYFARATPAPDVPELPSESPVAEIQRLTQEYLATHRFTLALASRGSAVEQHLRALGANLPPEIHWTSSELAAHLANAESDLADERARLREVEDVLGDALRECAVPALIPQLLEALEDEAD